MEDEGRYFVVRRKAVPEVLLKVVEAKKLLNSGKRKHMSVKEATDLTGISRSSFYKYKDDIFPFSESAKGKTITLSIEILDEPGLLSDLLHVVAVYHANVLTIHQSVPVSGVAAVSISVEVLKETGNISEMVDEMEQMNGVTDVKILARE
jgi:chorismate mutase